MTLEEWTDTIKESTNAVLQEKGPDEDLMPLLHVEVAENKEVIIGLPELSRNKDKTAAVIYGFLQLSEAPRCALLVTAWARVAGEENPLSDREKEAMKDGSYHASVSPDRIEVISITVGERRAGKEPRLGTVMGKIIRSDGPPQIAWEFDDMWEEDGADGRTEGRFPDAIRGGLS